MASLNKQALLRYRVINEQIRRHSYPSMEELLEACESKIGVRFSTETIQKDIRAMKNDEALGYEAPIHFNRLHRGYEYLIKDYSIENVNLSDNEYDVLENMIDILKQFRGSKLGTNYNSAVDKVSTSIREHMEQRTKPVISLEPQSEYIGLQDIDNFIRYIKECIPISVVNTKHGDFIGDIIHPYMLKEYHNRWYVIAYSEHDDSISVFDIRFLYDVYELTNRKFIFKIFNEDAFFKHSIGVGIQEDLLEKTQIEFRKVVYDEVNSIPLHPSQTIVKHKKNGDFVVELEVYITNEFFNEILSFGPSAKVIKPNWVVGMMKCYIQTMAEAYKLRPDECSKKYRIKKKK